MINAEVHGLTADAVTDTERAVLGLTSARAISDFFNRYADDFLGCPIAAVRFRSGRIDVVWGVELVDGRAVALKAHRQPIDMEALRATREAQQELAATGFPCPEPLSSPDRLDGHVVTAETLMSDGVLPDGRDPLHRRLLADGLAKHIDLLRHRRDLLDRVAGPSWCQYHRGPWPTPHDTMVDFSSTPAGYEWLDSFARQASDQILAHRGEEQVVGHADWYAGNTAVSGQYLVASFDWELVADAEAVIAGFTAACYAASPASGANLSTPEMAAGFLLDYDAARGARSTLSEQRAAAGAVAWILAFNARWQVGLIPHRIADMTTVTLVEQRQRDYLDIAW